LTANISARILGIYYPLATYLILKFNIYFHIIPQLWKYHRIQMQNINKGSSNSEGPSGARRTCPSQWTPVDQESCRTLGPSPQEGCSTPNLGYRTQIWKNLNKDCRTLKIGFYSPRILLQLLHKQSSAGVLIGPTKFDGYTLTRPNSDINRGPRLHTV
jgi:hypothetical protein